MKTQTINSFDSGIHQLAAHIAMKNLGENMTIALKAIDGGSKQRSDRNKQDSKDKSIRPHCKISIEDINWVRQQPPCVQQLWLDSVAAEQFGGSAHKLETNLTYKSFQKAGAALTAEGLFQFEEVFGRLPSGRPGLIGYRVRNLHGYYNRFYWESSTTEGTASFDEKAVHAEEKTNQAEAKQNHPGVEQIHPDLEQFQKNGQKSEELQGFQNPNNVTNYYLTTYQQPTKVVGMVVGSDAPAENLCVEETAIAPLGGASPPVQGCASEEEQPPAVADCTSLTLVDAVQGELASLLMENQACGNDPKVPGEDTYSAAPAAQNEKSLSYAETKLHSEQEYSASLPADNPIYYAEPENLRELTNSAPQVEVVTTFTKNGESVTGNREQGEFNYNPDKDNSNPAEPPVCEKWSMEAIAQRSQRRPARTARLNTAKTLGESPGFEYLQECWNDDPALQILVKKLLAKFPQWGIACVDGKLVDGNG